MRARVMLEPSGRSSTSSRHPSSASSTTSSTRAATATASPARTSQRTRSCRRQPPSRTCSGGATPTCAPKTGALGRSAPGDDRRTPGRQAAGAARLQRRGGVQRGSLGPDAVRAWAGHWQLRETLDRPGGRTSSPNTTTRRATRTPPTASAARSISSIRRRTTSTGWPIRSAGGTSTTFAPASTSRRSRLTPIAVNYHSYWLAETRDALYAASGAPARPRRGRRRAQPRRPGDRRADQHARSRRSSRWRPATPHLFAGPFLKEATPGQSYSGPFVMVTYVFLAEK